LSHKRHITWLDKISDINVCFHYIKGAKNQLADIFSRPTGMVRTPIRLTTTVLYSQLNNLSISKDEINKILDIHSSIEFIHPGKHKMLKIYNRINIKIYKMTDTISGACKFCDRCQRFKNITTRQLGNPQQFEIPEKIYDHVTMYFTRLMVPSYGFQFVAIIVDRLLRYIWLRMYKDTPQSNDMFLFLKQTLEQLGKFPKNVLTDKETEFNNVIWRSSLNAHSVKHSMTTWYYPEGDGLSKRFLKR
jgi:Integrase core domain